MGYKAELDALVLGALKDGPLHGYRIAQTIKAGSNGALKLGDNQIYPTLHRLERDGLVASEWQPQEGKPPRKVYNLTEEGHKRLEIHRRKWEEYAANFTALLGAKQVGHA
jgi:PadR family transcriptional regulator, regulatory protein PadR